MSGRVKVINTTVGRWSGHEGRIVVGIQLATSPRHWQLRAYEKWYGEQRGIVKVVTGGGKTLFALMCIDGMFRKYQNLAVVIVVPTTSLIDQWYLALTDEAGLSDSEIATYAGGSRPAPARVNLMTLNAARARAPILAGSGSVFLIVDECHRAGSQENAKALEGPHEATLGLSATPERESDDALGDVLVPALGPVIYEYGYDDARRDEVIVPFNLANVEVPFLEQEAERYGAQTRRISALMRRREEGEGVDEALKQAFRSRAREASRAAYRVPVAVKLAERHKRERILVFHESVRSANEIAGLLRSRNLRSTVYHSGLDLAVRRDNLRLFRDGQYDVLVTCRALDEGLNVPDTSVAIIASSTASPRQRIQRLGRVLRPTAEKNEATIYTLCVTTAEKRRLEREATLLGEVKSVTWHQIESPL